MSQWRDRIGSIGSRHGPAARGSRARLLVALTALALGLGAVLGARPGGASETEAVPASEREVVVLLHGLGRSSFSMSSLAKALREAGYETVNVDYPSTRLEADQLGGMLGERLDGCCRDAPRLHFVTHSMGGIVVRAHLSEHRPDNLGRVVMLAPPNRGSEWVDLFGDVAVFEWIMGPSAAALGTDPESLPNRLPPADFPLGVIAGTGFVNPVGAGLIPGDDDGTVSVESAQLDGMSDFITLPVSHSFIMYSNEVAAQILSFLAEGRFDHTAAERDADATEIGEHRP